MNLPLEEHLLENEKILYSTRTVYDGHLYITNQRLIRFYTSLLSEKFDSIPNQKILGTCYNKKPFTSDVVIGVGMAVFGIIAVMLFDSITVNLIAQLMFGLVFIGITLVIISFFAVEKFYEIKAIGLSNSDQAVWRTADAGNEAKCFAKFINDQIINGHLPANSKELVLDSIKHSAERI